MNMRDLFKVYFVKPVGFPGPIKIGISNNPEHRCREFESWSALQLEFIGSVPGRWADEQFLHECLAEHHSHGEWFHASPLVLETMKMVLSSGGFETVRASLVPVMNMRSKKVRAARTKPRLPEYQRYFGAESA